jgi:DnaJ-class molecular chaperone
MEEMVDCRRCNGKGTEKKWDPTAEVYHLLECWVCDGLGTVDKSMYEA